METPKASISAEGYIDVSLSGDLTAVTIEELERQIVPLVDQLKRQGKPIRSLVDLSGAGKYSPGSNKASMNLMENIPYEKVAMYGANFALKEAVKLITMAMGKSDNTKIFDTREQALDWLNQSSQSSNPVQ